MICPYCHEPAEFISSAEFYGRDYGSNLYICRPCGARVGTHKNSKRPLGTMANVKLRALRKICHRQFDPKWKSKQMSRSAAYRWLAEKMEVPQEKAHIGMFNEEQCYKLIKILITEERKKLCQT